MRSFPDVIYFPRAMCPKRYRTSKRPSSWTLKMRRYRQVLAVAYNNLGLRLTRERNVRDGVLFLSKALNVGPDHKEIRSNFVQAVLQAVTDPEEKITVEEKVDFLKQVIEIEPGNTAAQKAMVILLNNCGVAKGRTGFA